MEEAVRESGARPGALAQAVAGRERQDQEAGRRSEIGQCDLAGYRLKKVGWPALKR